jgi:predicted membrane protein DUF2232
VKSLRQLAGYSILTAVMFVTPLFVFLPAALFHAGVRHGKRLAWSALPIGAFIAALLAIPTSHAPGTTPAEANMSFAYLIALILGIGLPSLLVLPLVQRGESFGRVLMIAVLSSMLGLTATQLIMQNAAGFSPYADQIASAKVTAAKFITAYQQAGIPSEAITFLKKWMNIGVYCLPAFLLMDVALVFVLSLVMLGRLRAWRDFVEQRQKTFTSPYLFRNLALPEWLLFAFVIGGLSPLATGLPQRVGANVLALVVFLYLLQGLAIFRAVLTAAGAGFVGVMFAYFLLGLLTLTGIGPLLLSIAGIFDSFFDFRHFNRKDHPDESHLD